MAKKTHKKAKKSNIIKTSLVQKPISIKQPTQAISPEPNKKLQVHHSGNKKYPDFVFLGELIVLFAIVLTGIKLSPFFGPSLPYTKEELEQMKKLNITNFTMDDIAKIELELKSLEDHKNFFKLDPFSDDVNGIKNIQASAVMLPMVSFILVFVVPPIVGAYLLWFIIKYWKDVYLAFFEFIKMIMKYSIDAIEGMLASKWWIRKFTHWHKRSPSFGSYFDKWRRKYVDRPIYKEQMKYAKTYFEFKRKYWDVPYRKHVIVPTERLKIKLEFAKKIYITRALDTIFRKILNIDKNPNKIRTKEIMAHLNGANNADIDKNIAQSFAKLKQTKAAVNGKKIEINNNNVVITKNNNNKTLNNLKTATETNGKDTIEHFYNKTNDLYDNNNAVNIKDESLIMFYISFILIIFIVVFVIFKYKLYIGSHMKTFYLISTLIITLILNVLR